ncbi:MAG: transketolase C-terminal domain-containing protein, partial [Acidimicrobiales bacterium]
GLHGVPVVFALDRSGITGDDGPSHHGVLDMALSLTIPGMTVFAPSSSQELPVMLNEALSLDGPSAIRFPKTPARNVPAGAVGSGLSARKVCHGDGTVCILAVGKMLEAAEDAAGELAATGIAATVWDVRVVKPLDADMVGDASVHKLVVTVEDGVRVGGAGAFIADHLSGRYESRHTPPVLVLGTPLEYIPQGKPAQILAAVGLDGPGIAGSVIRSLEAGAATALDPAQLEVD